MATPESKRGPVRLYAFKLNGKTRFPTPQIVIPPVPKPPEQTGTPDMIKKGAVLYGTFVCDGCHSPGLDGTGAWIENGVIPDLRYMPSQAHKDWNTTVLGGTHWEKGMPGFSDPPKFAFPNMKMTVQDADAIHSYVIDGAWKLYRGEQESAHTKRENY
jgi:quinohemoprotein ethanol dehydrogenase